MTGLHNNFYLLIGKNSMVLGRQNINKLFPRSPHMPNNKRSLHSPRSKREKGNIYIYFPSKGEK